MAYAETGAASGTAEAGSDSAILCGSDGLCWWRCISRSGVTMAGVTAQDAQSIQALERRCRENFEYACAEMLWIRPKDEALCKLNLLWPQRYVHRRFLKPAWDRREPLGLVVLKTRRIFMTT